MGQSDGKRTLLSRAAPSQQNRAAHTDCRRRILCVLRHRISRQRSLGRIIRICQERREKRWPKREALKSAGIPLVEIRASVERAEIFTELRKKNPVTATQQIGRLAHRSGSYPLEDVSSPNIIRLDQDHQER